MKIAKQVSFPKGHLTTSHLKKWILVQDQGRFGFQTGSILAYVEDLKPGSNKDIEPKAFFKMAGSIRFNPNVLADQFTSHLKNLQFTGARLLPCERKMHE
jgi:hypothetical protein